MKPSLELREQINAAKRELDNKALVLLSGGQDSTTLLHFAMKRHGAENVAALGFCYGQRHETELVAANKVSDKYNVPYTVLDLTTLAGVGRSALTDHESDVSKPHESMDNVPASFVPGRNAMFLTLAYTFAQTIGAHVIYGGMCQTDYSGYPDCREPFIQALNKALDLGYPSEKPPRIMTPLMHLTKAQTFALAAKVGALDDVITLSHTCYEGDRNTLHAWGYGCGKCPACELRAKGWEEYKAGNI